VKFLAKTFAIFCRDYTIPTSHGNRGWCNTNRTISIRVASPKAAQSSRAGIIVVRNCRSFCQKLWQRQCHFSNYAFPVLVIDCSWITFTSRLSSFQLSSCLFYLTLILILRSSEWLTLQVIESKSWVDFCLCRSCNNDSKVFLQNCRRQRWLQ
jgi:hypothetical protein